MRKRTSILLVVFIFLSLVIFLTRNSPPVLFLESIVEQALLPPKEFLYHILIKDVNDKSEIAKLAEENKKLLEKLADYETVKKDNIALKGQFENSPIPPEKLLSARVVGFLGKSNLPHALIINKGKDDGVKPGNAVIFEKNLVGKILSVAPHLSQILLPVDKRFSVLGKTLQDNAIGVVSGEDDFILLDHVVITDKLTNGDLVVTRGEQNNANEKIQPDLIVGKIVSIGKQETKPFQNAKIESLIDYSRLRIVFVAK